MSAYGDDLRVHRFVDGQIVCTAPPDARCRTVPTCDCESWSEGDYGEHDCYATAEAGADCWIVEWIDAVGVEESWSGPWVDGGASRQFDALPAGPVTFDWDDGVSWDLVAEGGAS